MSRPLQWGIMATGYIARKFAEGLRHVQGASLHAVGSRSEASAREFAKLYNVPRFYNSYEDLVKDNEVDIIYVATPHSLHKANCLLALESEKHVLCEKPFTLNAREAKEVIDTAQQYNLFLMEAMWTRFLPVMLKVKELIDNGVIGNVHIIDANLGFKAEPNHKSRLFDPSLGGGALLDIGVYLVSLAHWFLGRPQQITSMAQLDPKGIDEQTGIILGYDNGAMANLFTSIRPHTSGEAVILGERGRIRIFEPLFRPKGITLSIVGEKDQYIHAEMEGNGFNYEAEEVIACIKKGKTESNIMPLGDTLKIMQTMDNIREQWEKTHTQS